MPSPASSATTRPARMHEDPVGEPEHLLDLVGDQQDRDAAGGELDDQLVDVALRADVDAACRLVGDEHRRVGEQGAREQELLLVAAGQRGRRSSRAALDAAARRSASFVRVDSIPRRTKPNRPSDRRLARLTFSRTGRRSIRPSSLRDSGIIETFARRDPSGVPVRRVVARGQLAGGGRRRRRRSPGPAPSGPAPTRPGEGHDLAGPDLEGRAVHARRGQVPDGQRRRARRPPAAASAGRSARPSGRASRRRACPRSRRRPGRSARPGRRAGR